MRRLSSIAMVALFAIFIGSPLVMLGLGFEAEPIENRKKIELEAPSASSIADASWFDILSGAILDNLPLRPAAVRADAWIDLNVLGDSPTSRVILGDDGWLYTRGDFDARCLEAESAARFRDEIETSARIFDAVGKRLLFMIAPDKSAVYPEYLPRTVDTACYEQTTDLLARIRSPNLVTGWDELRRARATRPVYFKLNTHWNRAGAAVMAAMLVDALRPGLWDEGAVVATGHGMMEGDLTRILGLPRSERYEVFDARRPGVRTRTRRAPILDPAGGQVPGIREIAVSTTGGLAVAGETLVLHDSFGWALSHFVMPYLGDATFINAPQPERPYLWPYLRRADTVVIESVQRGVVERVLTTRMSEKIATVFASSLPPARADVARGPSGFVVGPPPEGAVWFAVVSARGGGTVRISADGRSFALGADAPMRAIRVPPQGFAISADAARSSVRVVAVPA